MLPAGFHWNKTSDRLRLRDHTLIMIEPEHYPVPLINIMRSCLPRRLFFSTHEIAIRYSEMWSIKWEADIRLFVGNLEGAAKLEWSRRQHITLEPSANSTSQQEPATLLAPS
jgi:hypothetical protein